MDTTAPTEKLEVAGKAIIRKSGTATAHGDTDLLVTDATAASSTAAIQILGGNAGFSNLQFSDTDSYSQGAIMYGHTDNYMAFKANAAEKMRITNTGLGIGTTSPSEKLEVAGNIKATKVISDYIKDSNSNGTLTTTVLNASNTSTSVGSAGTTNLLTLNTKSSSGIVTIPNGKLVLGLLVQQRNFMW